MYVHMICAWCVGCMHACEGCVSVCIHTYIHTCISKVRSGFSLTLWAVPHLDAKTHMHVVRQAPSPSLFRFSDGREFPGACMMVPCTRCQLHPNMQLLLLQPNLRLPNTSPRPSGTSTSPTSVYQVGAAVGPVPEGVGHSPPVLLGGRSGLGLSPSQEGGVHVGSNR